MLCYVYLRSIGIRYLLSQMSSTACGCKDTTAVLCCIYCVLCSIDQSTGWILIFFLLTGNVALMVIKDTTL